MAKRASCGEIPAGKRCKIDLQPNVEEKAPPADFLLDTDNILRGKAIYESILRKWYDSTDWPELPDTIYEEILSFTPHLDHRPQDLYDMTAKEFGLKSFADSGIHQKKTILCYKILKQYISTEEGFLELVHECQDQDSLKYGLREDGISYESEYRILLRQARDKIISENEDLFSEVQAIIRDRENCEHSPYNAYQCTAFLLSINFYTNFYIQDHLSIPLADIPSYRYDKIDELVNHELGVFLLPKTHRANDTPDVSCGYPSAVEFDRWLSREPLEFDYIADDPQTKWWKEGFVLYWPRYGPEFKNYRFFSDLQRFEYGIRREDDLCSGISVSNFMHLAVDGPKDPRETCRGGCLLAISGTRLNETGGNAGYL